MGAAAGEGPRPRKTASAVETLQAKLAAGEFTSAQAAAALEALGGAAVPGLEHIPPVPIDAVQAPSLEDVRARAGAASGDDRIVVPICPIAVKGVNWHDLAEEDERLDELDEDHPFVLCGNGP